MRVTVIAKSASSLVAVVVVAGWLPAAVAAAVPGTPWYWAANSAQAKVVGSSITWTAARTDVITGASCSPVGGWMSPDRSTFFHHFFCTVSRRGGAPYLVLVTPASATSMDVSWVGVPRAPQWYWSTQKAADTLATEGVRWPSGTDRVLNDACVSIGAAYKGMYATFDCAVGTPRSADGKYGYQVLVHVTGKNSYSLTYVDDDATAGPRYGNESAISGSFNPALTQMTLTTAWWSNEIRFGTPFPHPSP